MQESGKYEAILVETVVFPEPVPPAIPINKGLMCAGKGSRTLTRLPSLVFETSLSAISAPRLFVKTHYIKFTTIRRRLHHLRLRRTLH